MKKEGFTLVELLVVIAIIGILSTIAVVNLNAVREQAKIAKAQSDMATISRAIQVARLENDSILYDITGSYYSSANCVDRDLYTNHVLCLNDWLNALNKIANIGGFDASSLQLDPWGNPYLLDENQGESPPWSCSTNDTLRSAGPDGRVSQSGDPSYNTDNTYLLIPLFDNCP